MANHAPRAIASSCGQRGSSFIGRSITWPPREAQCRKRGSNATSAQRRYMLSSSCSRTPLACCASLSSTSTRELARPAAVQPRIQHLLTRLTFCYSAFWGATIDVAAAKREGLRPELLDRLRNSSRILLTWVSLPGMKQSVSALISQIESLLEGGAPPPLPQPSGPPFTNPGGAAFDPSLWQRQTGYHPAPHTQPMQLQHSLSNSLGAYGMLPQPKLEDASSIFGAPPMMMQHHHTLQGFQDPSFTAAPAAHQPNGELYFSLPPWTIW